MTEIEMLEQEIAQKKERLKLLKEMENPHFHYEIVDEYFKKQNYDHIVVEKLKNHMRSLAKTMTTAYEKMNYVNKRCIHTSLFVPKMEDIGAEKIALCNEFFKEVMPIIGKYMDKFLEMNKEGRNA